MVEMAFWDIIGKATNQPVYKLLGEKSKTRYKHMQMDGIQLKEIQIVSLAASKVVSRGYKSLKFDPFGNGDLGTFKT